jgi:hypothetical protein
MPPRTDDTCDAHIWTYRDHLRSLNQRLAEDDIRRNGRHVVEALQELARAAPVTLAIAQLHHAIRSSPARNFWPVIRKTKGVLFIRSSDAGEDGPWPWRRTATGNLRYDLPGHLVFSPWPPNVRRRVRNRTIGLERVLGMIQAMPDIADIWFQILPDSISHQTRQAEWLIDEIKALQGIAMPDSIAALDRWSDDPLRASNIVLRISQGTLVYQDGSERCAIDIPDVLTRPLRIPSTPDRAVERH